MRKYIEADLCFVEIKLKDRRGMTVKRRLPCDAATFGFLDGAAPSNKGGLELQRSDYRGIFQMGMGLMAQLIAALKSP